ncbi:unnamed protein product [Onchocerca flexuosa]|uniref:RRM domain-containing protein n=1 Tax=Onchocerca flexuosa TaxID=387005 RepID=A0A183HC31_9BILA|nr:unnamed protein product [Onchocerca flexuosa]
MFYNVRTLGDPRNPLTRFRNVESIDLPLPSFVLDNNSVGPQPKREVSIFGLNDNINHAFLSDMCQKTGQIIEVFVYMHPRTKKHLGMAYVVFQDVGKAQSFVAKNNGTSVMGQTITCIIDPYAKEISRLYEKQAVEAAPVPRYLSRLDYNRLTEFRRISSASISEHKDILSSPSPSISGQQSTDFKILEPAPQKQPDKSETGLHHNKDRQIHEQSVDATLTKTSHIENVVPPNECSTILSTTEHFSPFTVSPSSTNLSYPSLTTMQAANQTFSSHHFMSNQHSQTPFTYYHSIPSNPISPLSNFSPISSSVSTFSPLPPLPPITGRMPFPIWSNVPPPPLRTSVPNTWPRAKTIVSAPVPSQILSIKSSAPTISNFASTTYQAVPSTSSFEETAPMDPAPSKVSFFKSCIIVVS